jgi:hypothetical protein
VAVGTCQSCGRDGEEVEAVQRVYLVLRAPTPGEGSGGGSEADRDAPDGDGIEVLDEVEYWCATCRESFPHVPVAGPEPDDAG